MLNIAEHKDNLEKLYTFLNNNTHAMIKIRGELDGSLVFKPKTTNFGVVLSGEELREIKEHDLKVLIDQRNEILGYISAINLNYLVGSISNKLYQSRRDNIDTRKAMRDPNYVESKPTPVPEAKGMTQDEIRATLNNRGKPREDFDDEIPF